MSNQVNVPDCRTVSKQSSTIYYSADACKSCVTCRHGTAPNVICGTTSRAQLEASHENVKFSLGKWFIEKVTISRILWLKMHRV